MIVTNLLLGIIFLSILGVFSVVHDIKKIMLGQSEEADERKEGG